jgi:Cdc6-like AAA superfamily ATPase
MASIEQLIKQSVNPFDNFYSRNFWQEQQDKALTVESIHQEALTQIQSVLEQVTHDHNTRTLLLYGDSGVGKTHFLGRLKKTLNSQAFFAYIEPFPQSEEIWRHILRYTVDSLLYTPDGQKDSQLLLWLKSCLSAIRNGLESDQKKLIEKIKRFGDQENDYNLSERQNFIEILKKTFGTAGIYNANEFFGILYDLTNPKLYFLVCEWLKGDHLDEDSLQQLRVGRAIDTENAARKLLANFSKLSAKTQPIVLCFDQLDNIARLPDNSIDLPALFSANSTIHNENWQGLLVIISIINSRWNQEYRRIPPADLARITSRVSLKHITLEEAKAIWVTRLYWLHRQAQPKVNSHIYPLTEEWLEKEFPGGKALPRDVLTLGQQLIQVYKVEGKIPNKPFTPPSPSPPCFKLVWLDEFNKVQQKITRIRQFSSTELMRMLQEALSALQVGAIQPKLLPSSAYTACSLSYQLPGKSGRIGVAWTEEPNMNTFCNVMKACHKVVQKKLCETLYLIRTEGVGKPDTVGNRIYAEIFTSSEHHRIEPDLTSVHYLATYHSLVNASCAGDLVIGGKIINLQELEALIRESGILRECTLFKQLGIFPDDINDKRGRIEEELLNKVKGFLLNLVQTNHFLGRKTLINNGKNQFPQVNDSQLEQLIQQLCQENKIQIIDPKAKLEAQIICFVPQVSGVKK